MAPKDNRQTQPHTFRAIRRAIAASLMLVLAGCSGGGGGDPFVAPPVAGNGWQRDVFQPSENFKSSCAAPRTGINPATGQRYPDRTGTLLNELNYLRSFSDETYLWYDEIIDRDPSFYSDALSYFDVLKTNRTDANGELIDKFHFTYDSEEWFELSQTGVSAGYGAILSLGSPTPPRNVVVAYVEAGSPAAFAGFTRGMRILSADGVDIDDNSNSGIDTLNDALFPSDVGVLHTFEVQDLSGQTRTLSVRTATISIDPVPLTDVMTLPDQRRVGYMLFNDHIATAELALIEAVEQLNAGAGIDELVLDLRYNGGGFLALASQISYMIAGTDATANRSFETLQFNDKHPVVNPVTGQTIMPTPFYSNTLGPPFNGPLGMALPTLDVAGVTIITGADTCSASEAIINGLRGIDLPVTLVGERTCGKPFGFYAQDNCGTTYFTVQFQGVNDKGFGDYPNGFVPQNSNDRVGIRVDGCEVADDLSRDLGDPAEGRLQVAMNLMSGGQCPAVASASQKSDQKAASGAPAARARIIKPQGLTNRIATP